MLTEVLRDKKTIWLEPPRRGGHADTPHDHLLPAFSSGGHSSHEKNRGYNGHFPPSGIKFITFHGVLGPRKRHPPHSNRNSLQGWYHWNRRATAVTLTPHTTTFCPPGIKLIKKLGIKLITGPRLLIITSNIKLITMSTTPCHARPCARMRSGRRFYAREATAARMPHLGGAVHCPPGPRDTT